VQDTSSKARSADRESNLLVYSMFIQSVLEDIQYIIPILFKALYVYANSKRNYRYSTGTV
jgi:hypothetical protein